MASKLSPQHKTILDALERGIRLTPAISLAHFHIYALSQRCGELKRMVYPIVSQIVRMPSGARVAQYELVREGKPS